MLDPVLFPRSLKQRGCTLVTGKQVLADVWENAAFPLTNLHGLLISAGEAVHVGGRAAYVTDAASKPGFTGHSRYF